MAAVKAFINAIISKTGYQLCKANTDGNRRAFVQKAILDWKPNGRILELGAVDGWISSHFADVTTFNQEGTPDVKGDLHALSSYFAEPFDTVICTEVFEHTKDPLRAIMEIRKVLKPGGVFIGSAPCATDLHGEEYGDYWRITPQGWAQLLSGFSAVEMRKLGTHPAVRHIAVRACGLAQI